jgi:hypothetical protein
MINSSRLLADLQSKSTSRATMVKRLEDDLRKRCNAEPEVDAPLKEQYQAAKTKKRTALTYKAWRDEELTQIAVAWVLGCVFVRFLEDNGLVETPKLSGPGERLRRARDEHELFFKRHPTSTEREFLLEVFEETGRLPGMKDFFDKRHNPLWLAAPSGDACRELWLFWQKTDPETGNLLHDFTDPDWNTRFLGDLYQDLSEAARKKYALLQTPDFVEEFILDRTLTPAIETFGYREVRMIDPTCGSGHFLLGGFARIFRIWQNENPGENPRVLAQRALDAVCGVDLNPFAVAIARFRLLLAALQVCGVKRLKDAPDFQISLAVGDSLIHGARFSGTSDGASERFFNTGEDPFRDELAHFFDTEDSTELHRILGRQYHAVVGNPPYIQVSDKALNLLYRGRYDSCHRKYSLAAPFMERFFDLALNGASGTPATAGFTGQITANSFMKGEFGRPLVETFFPRWDVTTIVDTSGAKIPGHGTPTVILFGRNQKPTSNTIRCFLGIEGDPGDSENPELGPVWQAIVTQLDIGGSESKWGTVGDLGRVRFYQHPWSLTGGGTAELKSIIENRSVGLLDTEVESIGFGSILGEDECFVCPPHSHRIAKLSSSSRREFVEGACVRDWAISPDQAVIFPYSEDIEIDSASESIRILWPWRAILESRVDFQKRTYKEAGRHWLSFHQIPKERAKRAMALVMVHVSTTNHFCLNRSLRAFNRSAPLIHIKDGSEKAYLRIASLLNSCTGCFWMKQVMGGKHKGDGGTAHASKEGQRFNFDGTKLKQFPLPAGAPLKPAIELDRLAQELSEQSPDALTTRDAVSSAALADAEQASAVLRCRMISLQEELDWQCYRHYGLVNASDDLEWPEDLLDALPPLSLGERAFEIRMARQMEEDLLETTWFERHKESGSKPITELPAQWPDNYRALVERRLAFIESNKNINLIERPEYKRRWTIEPWVKRQQEALRKWLLARLEGYFFDGNRVCDLQGSFDPAAHGFTAATRPHLVTVNQLADVVQADKKLLEAAEVYEGASGFSVPKLIRSLVEAESVPYLPAHRYKDSGLRKCHDWEETWELQRKEDAVEARVRNAHAGEPEGKLKERVRKAQQAEVGDIAMPPKYASTDFAKSSYWAMRGKLDVPKERWISYPGAERAGDDSLLIAWAGWDHLQQAKALSEYFIDAQQNQGFPTDRLKPLLAGLADLIPWLKQWHNDPDPNLGMGLGDYFAGFLEENCRLLEITVKDADKARFEG